MKKQTTARYFRPCRAYRTIYTPISVSGAPSNAINLTDWERGLNASWKISPVIFCLFSLIFFVAISGCSDDGKTTFMQKTKGGSVAKSFFAPKEDDIVEDKETGLKIIKDVISVTFKPDTDEATIEKIIASVNGEIVGYDKAVNFYQIRFPGVDLATLDSIRLKLLGGFKEVELASRSVISVHKNPFYAR